MTELNGVGNKKRKKKEKKIKKRTQLLDDLRNRKVYWGVKEAVITEKRRERKIGDDNFSHKNKE